jgi:hypothetical protein
MWWSKKHRIPEGCDFEMVAGEIRDMMEMTKKEAAVEGEQAFLEPRFANALASFLQHPSSETAGPLLEVKRDVPLQISVVDGSHPAQRKVSPLQKVSLCGR